MRACGKILAGLFLIALVSIVVCGVYWLFGGGRSFWDLRGTIDVVAFDPLARWVALGGRDVGTAQYKDRGDVKLCDPRTGKVLQVIVLPSRPWGMAVNHNGTLLATYSVMTGSSYSLDVFAIPPDGTPVKAHTQTLSFPSQDVFGFVGTHLVCAGKEMLTVLNTGDWTVATKVSSYRHRPVLDPSSNRLAWGQEINGQLAVLLWRAGGNPTQLAGARVPFAFRGRAVSRGWRTRGLARVAGGAVRGGSRKPGRMVGELRQPGWPVVCCMVFRRKYQSVEAWSRGNNCGWQAVGVAAAPRPVHAGSRHSCPCHDRTEP
jgi:hypothetical protein